jgi:hypothetical protein
MAASNELLLNLATYLQPTRFSGPGGVVLGMQVLSAAPTSPTPPVHASLTNVREATVSLQSSLGERLVQGGSILAALDTSLDAIWVGVRMSLEGLARFEGTDTARRAAELLSKLLPQGTGFVKATYAEQWSTTDNLLQRIDELALADQIEALLGAELLSLLRSKHEAYGRALGIGGTVDEPDTRAIQEGSARLARALVDYGRVMVGWVQPDDADSVAAFQRAMRPIDRHRATFYGRASAPADEPTPEPVVDVGEDAPSPTDPVPPVPPLE